MAQDDIQGQVVDGAGNPVDGAIVELTKSYQSSPLNEQVVRRTTTDANGNYIFEFHPDGDGTTQEWHVSAYNHDGTTYVNSFNNPGVTADLRSNAIPDSGLLHEWTISEGSGTTVEDSAGSNDLSVSGATWEAGSNFYDGQGLDHDGNDDESIGSYVTEVASGNPFTVFLSTRVDSIPSNGFGIYLTNTSGSGGSSASGVGIGIDTRPTTQVIAGGTYNGSSFTATDSTEVGSLTAGNQITIFYTDTGSTSTLYVDLSSDGQNNGGTTATGGGGFSLGSDGAGEYSDITPGYVALWDRVLDSSERQAVHEAMPHT